MILVFVASNGSGGVAAPVLPDLHIEDSSTGSHIPVGGLEGWDSDYIQVQAIGYAPLEFQPVENSLVGEGVQYWTRRLSTFIIAPVFTASGATANARIVRIDKNGVKSYSEQVVLHATEIQDEANYIGETVTVKTYGAEKMAIHIESVSSGNINVRLAGV